MNIGLFGGSFNPIHDHHLVIAHKIREKCDLDEVWFVPVFQPVHKDEEELLPYEIRCEMVSLAISDFPDLRLSRIESEIGGPSFTINTVRSVRQLFPQHHFKLIIGADSLKDLNTWRNFQDLSREIPFIVVGRPDVPSDLPLPNSGSERVKIPLSSASSSKVRESIRHGKLKNLPVPHCVVAYIISKGLYNCLQNRYGIWVKAIREKSSDLKENLFRHLENVGFLAAQFAMAFDQDPRLAFIAGISHDLFRVSPKPLILKMAQNAGCRILKMELEAPMLAHGLACSGFLKSLLPEIPRQVLKAIRWHTFPRQRCNPLLKILVTADTLDPGRKNPFFDRIRNSNLPFEEKFNKVFEAKQRKFSI